MTPERQRPEDEAAAMTERLLAEVDAGRLTARGPLGSRLVRRLEGAAAAWRSSAERQSRPRRK